MQKKEIQNSNLSTVENQLAKEILNENILCSHLVATLKKYPPLVNSPELFRRACYNLRNDYISCFLKLNISLNALLNSDYKKALIDATWRLAIENNSKFLNRDQQITIIENQYKEILSAIKKYIKAHTAKNKR